MQHQLSVAPSGEQPTSRWNRHQLAWMMYRVKDAFGSNLALDRIGQSDSIWIKVPCLNIQDNDRLSFKQGQLLIVKGWGPNRSLMVWLLSPKLSGNGLNSFGNRWQYCRFCGGCGLCYFKKSFRCTAHRYSQLPVLLSKPRGFEKWLIIYFAGK